MSSSPPPHKNHSSVAPFPLPCVTVTPGIVGPGVTVLSDKSRVAVSTGIDVSVATNVEVMIAAAVEVTVVVARADDVRVDALLLLVGLLRGVEVLMITTTLGV